MSDDVLGAFWDWVLRKTGELPSRVKDKNKDQLKQLIAEFIHESENILRDWYGCDD